MSEDKLLDGSSTALITASDCKSIANWDDTKKKEFVKAFEDRTEVASYILHATAQAIHQKAEARKFLSYKHNSKIHPVNALDLHPETRRSGNGYNYYRENVGGRPFAELNAIANERADDIINKLPILKDAVKVIDNDTYELIEKHKVLQEACQKKKDQLEDLFGEVKMSEMDQNMTIG
jgi:hypothetical protein